MSVRTPARVVRVPTRPTTGAARAGAAAEPEEAMQPVQPPTGWMAQMVSGQLQLTATVTPTDPRDIVKSLSLTASGKRDGILYCQANLAFSDNDGAMGDPVSVAAITGRFEPKPDYELSSAVIGYVTGPAGTRFFNFEQTFIF